MIRPAYATVVLTLHREIMLEIDDAADESEEVLTDRVTQLAEQQFGTFDRQRRDRHSRSRLPRQPRRLIILR